MCYNSRRGADIFRKTITIFLVVALSGLSAVNLSACGRSIQETGAVVATGAVVGGLFYTMLKNPGPATTTTTTTTTSTSSTTILSVGGGTATSEGVGIGGSGAVWTREASANFTGRESHNCVVFDNKLWVIAGLSGSVYFNDAWSSADGVSWTRATAEAAFSPRFRAACAAFNGGDGEKLWLIGGGAAAVDNNEIWSSADGASWSPAGPAPFSSREAAVCLVFNHELWIIGGYSASLGTFDNSVWHSADGTTWLLATAEAAFSPRYRHAGAVLGTKMWITGGWNGSTELSDVWSSADGVTWTQAASSSPFSARSGHSCLAYADKLWVIAGQKGATLYSGVWSSSDGASWTLVTGEANFNNRFDLGGAVFNNSLWVTGGTDGANYYDDVWMAR
jgi:hypothetical protein